MNTIRTIYAIFLLLVTITASAQVPRSINYQGKLTNPSGVALEGYANIDFRLYATETGGTPLWHETKTVYIDKGLFDVQLDLSINGGDTLKFNMPYWLALEVDTDGEMDPRQTLATVSYSFRSIYADTAYHAIGGGSASDDDWQVSGDDMYSMPSGKVGIGTSTPGYKLEVNGTMQADNIRSGSFDLPTSIGASGQFLSYNGTWEIPSGGSGIPGGDYGNVQFNNSGTFGGTNNFKWVNDSAYLNIMGSGTTPVVNIIDIKNDIQAKMAIHTYCSTYPTLGSNITLSRNRGTLASPEAVKTDDVIGYITFSGGGIPYSGHIAAKIESASERDWGTSSNDSKANLKFYSKPYGSALTERMRISGDGYVGIGTTNPSAQLHTTGSVRFAGISGSGSHLTIDEDGNITRTTISGSPSTAWSLDGNTGTIDGTNFIGTTDNVPFNIRINNQKAGRISTDNTTYGYLAGNAISTGTANQFSGTESGYYLLSGSENTFLGRRAGYFMQSGSSNTAVGYNALYCYGAAGGGPFPGGNGNVAIGKWAMFNPTSGDYNVAIGFSTYSLPHSGSQNVFIGHYSDAGSGTNINGSVGIGAYSEISGNYATALGYRAYATQDNTIILGSINGQNSATETAKVGIGTNDLRSRLQVEGGFALGSGNAIASADGVKRSIQIASDTYYGGEHDNHTGYLIYSTFPIEGWTHGKLHFACGTDWGIYNTTTPALTITQTGIYVNSTYYSSDSRIKTDIRKIPYGLEQVIEMKPLLFTKHIAEDLETGVPILGKGMEEPGFIAQDLYEIIPEVVSKPKNENEAFWAIDYARIVPVLVQAIQEQHAFSELQREKIEAQDKQIEILFERIEALENR
ncbi:tail fiber domain-containing protein [bacterium]|nr:tail fiber domain-containing protein [bacterium]